MKCPHCNAENAESAIFCVNCGTRINENGNADSAQPVTAPNTSASSEYVAPQPAAQPVESVNGEKPEYKTGWRKTVLLVGSICALVGIAISFIFTFLIGVAGQGSSYGISYFFGDWVVDLQEVMESMGGESSSSVVSATISALMLLLFQGGFSMMIMTGFIIAMIVVLIKSIIRFVKFFKGTDTKGIDKLSIGSYFAYATAATLIHGLFATTTTQSFLGMSETAKITFNGATIAGLVLGAICVAAFVGSRIAVRGKELAKKNVLVPTILTVVAIAFLAACAGLAAGPLLGASAEGTTVLLPFPVILATLFSRVNLESPESMQRISTQIGASYIGIIFLIILTSIIFATICKVMRNLLGKEYRIQIRFPIVILIFSILTLVAARTALNETARIVLFGGADGAFGPVIGLMIVSVLLLGVTIADIVVKKKMNKPAEAPKPVQY